MAISEINSPDQKSKVTIDKGELISYIRNTEELIHQKGAPGWRNSDTEMFPVIGPTENNGFKVNTPRGNAIQDQHGLLRELTYQLVEKSDQSIVFQKKYLKNTAVKNSKYPDKSTKEVLAWPYDFSFKKKYLLSNNALSIQFEVNGESGMPFMLGYHPAFKLSGNHTEIIKLSNKELKIQDILDVGSIAYPALNTNEISLLKRDGQSIRISTEGFNNFMLWTEVPNMICIEPITAYPYNNSKTLGEELFIKSEGTHLFQIVIQPLT